MKVHFAACVYAAIGVSTLALTSEQALANPISVNTATLNIFRDVRGQSDVHIAEGDIFQFGALINGGSLGTSIAGIFTPTGSQIPAFMTSFVPCAPLI